MDKKEIIEKIKSLEEELFSIRYNLLGEDLTFDEWREYAPKIDYYSLLGVDNKIMTFLKESEPWLFSFRYRVITLDYVIDLIDLKLHEKAIDQGEAEEIKEQLVRSNFNSMRVDW